MKKNTMKKVVYEIRMKMKDLKKSHEEIIDTIRQHGSIKAAWGQDGVASIRVLWHDEVAAVSAERALHGKFGVDIW
jgi:hypothetical protein